MLRYYRVTFALIFLTESDKGHYLVRQSFNLFIYFTGQGNSAAILTALTSNCPDDEIWGFRNWVISRQKGQPLIAHFLTLVQKGQNQCALALFIWGSFMGIKETLVLSIGPREKSFVYL
ncbi:hypothetical protein CDAR_36351 [Caerostris darwini]|uniref:Uncharacterized protein n=1 Tax=Caerostris darwini TaxID=1538125 RepID=A0AAV4SNX6_9ARAC|nr:hypothetical protein CDAR_36351 [Caerostris darwini]